MSRLAQDWPVYVLLTGVAVFMISVFIHGKRLEREERRKKEQSEPKEVKK